MKRILIANRGEIACRIIQTCKRLGIETIALASKADIRSKHVREADQAVVIGGSEAKDSYLHMAKIVAIAQAYHVDGVHPGYGFLSENPEFAAQLEAVGIKFIGPSVQAIEAMGSKSRAKAIAEEAGVPIIPGYRGEEQSFEHLFQEAERIGFPLLIKATYGGGGKGMRRVEGLDTFQEALDACKREALSAFGNDQVMLEKYVDQPRHIEVQVFGDHHGTVLTLAERDCSLQRRHQKIIEEAPGFNLSPQLKDQLSQAAKKIAKAVAYVGAGTVEFLVDGQENFYFLEMNTRLQVEHPVTEMVLGYDLVEWQIRVARGEALPVSQEEITPKGHAIEVRLYAEDPDNHFLPSIGTIHELTIPQDPNVRLDSGIAPGDCVTIFYDPMIAKIIVWGENRAAALTLLLKTLNNSTVKGVTTNIHFLKQLAMMPQVSGEWIDVGFIDRYMVEQEKQNVPLEVLGFAALWLRHQRQNSGTSPFDIMDDWRSCGLGQTTIKLMADTYTHDVHLHQESQGWRITVGEYQELYDVIHVSESGVLVHLGERVMTIPCQQKEDQILVSYNHHIYPLNLVDPKYLHTHDGGHQGNLSAPMPGRVISVLASAGQEVDLGAPLLILEAMKMEHTIRSPYKGVVESVFFTSGDFVEEGVELAKVKAA